MNKSKIARGILTVMSVLGVAILVVLFGISMTLYFKYPKNYDDLISPILIPFDVVCLVTIAASVIMFELRRHNKG